MLFNYLEESTEIFGKNLQNVPYSQHHQHSAVTAKIPCRDDLD